jgi:hypothetical protein
VQALPEASQGYLLPRALMAALQRFASTRNVQDVSEAVLSLLFRERTPTSRRRKSKCGLGLWMTPNFG